MQINNAGILSQGHSHFHFFYHDDQGQDFHIHISTGSEAWSTADHT